MQTSVNLFYNNYINFKLLVVVVVVSVEMLKTGKDAVKSILMAC